MEQVIIDTIHVVTLTWAISRIWSSPYAWKPLLLDAICAALAMFTWIIIMSISFTQDGFSEIAESPLFSLGAFIVVGSVYVGLTYLWVKTRGYLGDEPPDHCSEVMAVAHRAGRREGDERV